MAYSEIITRNDSVQVGPMIDIKFNEFANQDQKNWCPFEFNGTMLFVTNILPHRIVGLSSDYKWEGKPEGPP
jgi:glutathionyl-hydroquinone reductase